MLNPVVLMGGGDGNMWESVQVWRGEFPKKRGGRSVELAVKKNKG